MEALLDRAYEKLTEAPNAAEGVSAEQWHWIVNKFRWVCTACGPRTSDLPFVRSPSVGERGASAIFAAFLWRSRDEDGRPTEFLNRSEFFA
jgi:hypothetical protein